MSSEVQIIGLSDALNAFDQLLADVEVGAPEAVEETVSDTFDDSQKLVPYDAVTPHEDGYVHLRDSAEKSVEDLGDGIIEGTVSYGTDHNWFVEEGTSIMAAQPYAGPAFEANQGKLIRRCQDLVKR